MSTQREVLQQAAPAVTDWDVRGELAKSLTCWHRLTGQEAAELVTLYQRLSAPQQEVQEPVAWAYQWKQGNPISWYVTVARWPESDIWHEYPLYTAPQQAEPVQKPKRTVTYVCPVCAASLEQQE